MSTVEPIETKSTSYDEVPYPGGAFRNTHPSHLGMIARLLGLQPPTPSKCRVLELGCSMGANIIPMAVGHPDSEYVGIDFSEKQIAAAMKTVDELGIQNARFETKSILDITDSFGTFDYIICHGVYSWVSHSVQDKILEIANQNLSENGVMSISYNTYPGWHLRGVVRDMMKYHVDHIESPREKVIQARGLLKFLQDHAQTKFEAYTTLLKEEAEMLSKADNSYLYHEHLEEVNEPLYFNEFVRRVDHAGMRYLADAALPTMLAQQFDDEAAEILRNAPLLRREQYMDFLRNRMFRSSLICHQAVSPNYQITGTKLHGLHAALQIPLKSSVSGKTTTWENGGGRLTTEAPLTQVFEKLNDQHPNYVRIEDLLSDIADNAARLSSLEALLIGYLRGMLTLAFEPANFASTVSEKPTASLLARHQVQKKSLKITNLLHCECLLQPQQRFIVEHLDGTRTIEEVAEMLHHECADGRFKLSKAGEDVIPELGQIKDICAEELTRLSNLALLSS